MGLRRFCLSLVAGLLSFMVISNACAQEITAIDFNGDLLGKVIPDGKVVSFDNQLIGNVTADSLIVNSEGELIGGVVPQGVAIGNDNKLLGKVNSDGSVRLASGKIIGRVLPSGLVVDDFFNVVGSVLFPGLIYGDEGEAIGRLAGDGSYTNLQGQQIGFVSADGYAYRRINEDVVLEGRLISSKMVISSNGEFIGSVVPGGKVTNFDSQIIGSVKANGFVYNDENRVIGRTVKSGYAFNNSGSYIGFVTYNGEVVDSANKTIGRLTSEGNIINLEGTSIGFTVDLAATATDFTGKYLGRIMPSGLVVKSRDVIGQVGPSGVIIDNDGNPLGKIVTTGPIFDYRGYIRAHALKNGSVITLGGTTTGSVRGNIAYDNRGRVLGSTLGDVIIINNNNAFLGIPNINGVVKTAEDYNFVSPFGYVFSSEGDIVGSSVKLGSVYSLAGSPIYNIGANGEMVNKGVVSSGKITSSGIGIDERNLFIGKTITPKYAVNESGNLVGLVSKDNLVYDKSKKAIAKILPDNTIVSDSSNTTAKLSPKAGEALSNLLAFGVTGELLGSVDYNGSVRDAQGAQIGRVTSNNQIINSTGEYIGSTVSHDVAVNECELVGVLSSQGSIRNFREVNQGKILLNRQVISDTDKAIAYTFPKGTVVDVNGNLIGTVSGLGTVLNYNGDNLGCINKRGMLANAQGQIIAGVVETYPVMEFQGRIIGRSTIDGTVIADNNQSFGYLQPNGNVNSKTGIPLGSLFKYKVAFDNDNKFLGRVLETGRVISDRGEDVGAVDFVGYVRSNEQNIGYALYDMYIYDKDFNTIGYIAKDGNVLSFSGNNLGRLDRGFLIDKSQNLIGRGNRDFYIRDSLFVIIGELGLDGRVYDLENTFVGSLEKDGSIVNAEGIGIAYAKPLQYYDYIADRQKVYNEEGKLIGFVGGNDTVVNEDGDAIGLLKEDGTVIDGNGNVIGGVGIDWYEKIDQVSPRRKDDGLPQVGVKDLTTQSKRSFNIALTPDGEYLGEILDDGRVVDANGKVLGRKMPDGLIIGDDGDLIGIEDVKKINTDDMFVPAGAFGRGEAYGVGVGPSSNRGPGGGYGPGERYDPQRAAALAAAQEERRKSIAVGKISTNVRKESFDGMQKDWEEQGVQKSLSSWRVDMSEMILADKPIPAVIARSINSNNPTPVSAIVERNIYAEEGRNVLIPAGSRLIGQLGSVSASEERASSSAKIEITWDRLIRPDGSMFRFQGQTGDAQGRGGALGYLDQQLFKRYSLPILITALTSYTTYMMAEDDEKTTGETETSKQQAASDARQNFLNEMNSVFEQILKDKTSIQPLTYVPAGTRIIVYPTVDLWLRTPERDANSTADVTGADVLIDDKKETQTRQEANQQRIMANQAASNVVYSSDNNAEAQGTALIDDVSSVEQRKSSGATPPPPPPSSSYVPPSTSSGSSTSSSGSSSSSNTSSSNNNVPQLF